MDPLLSKDVRGADFPFIRYPRLADAGRRLGPTNSIRLILIVDEAHHISPNFRDYYSIVERYAVELRKYGMGLVVIATRPTLLSDNILANCNTLICHSLTSGKDIDLALNYMVNKLEMDRFITDIRRQTTPIRCRIGLDEHRFLLNPHYSVTQSVKGSSTGEVAAIGAPPVGDSAWRVHSSLPAWAKKAAAVILQSGCLTSFEKLSECGLSHAQAKEMIHGSYKLLSTHGRMLRLTPLGMKVGAIQLKPNGD